MNILQRSYRSIAFIGSRVAVFLRLSLLSLGFLLPFQQAFAVTEIDGAGSTAVVPILKEWISTYESSHPVQIHYIGGGSAEGIKRVTARAVDFAITDIGLTQSELSQDDLLQFPLLGFGITPVINIPGIQSGELQLTGEALANIYLGKITYWDDAAIKNLNTKVTLPHLPIQVVHRQDGSGSSFAFTGYLSKVNETWDRTLGMGSTLNWPVGSAEVGNQGIAKKVAAVEGAIGYVEYLYAQRRQLTTIRLQNRDGNFVSPSPSSFTQAFQNVSWKRPSYYESLTNLPGANSWPIMAVSYVLMHRTSNDRQDAKLTLDFFDWIYANGKNDNDAYIKIADPALVKRIKSSWNKIVDNKGSEVLK
jgi:phosphate transport system substrate-binding protein